MENFTPISAAAGGALIGMAAVLLMMLDGRIAGISGILGGLSTLSQGDIAWRIAFLAGLATAPMGYTLATGNAVPVEMQSALPMTVVAGLLVGIGTQLGSGCTSGHGVCGLARGSIRSLVATCIFMAIGIATVFVVRHAGGF